MCFNAVRRMSLWIPVTKRCLLRAIWPVSTNVLSPVFGFIYNFSAVGSLYFSITAIFHLFPKQKLKLGFFVQNIDRNQSEFLKTKATIRAPVGVDRFSTTPGNPGNLLELKNPPGNLEICSVKFVDREFQLIQCVVVSLTEIYRIVSQKQIQDGAGGDAHTPSNNVQTITVAPTASAGEQKKSCCNWW